ncbi:hypothetical protein GLA29479_3797 [Lysobacter antibioticus]|nr:hypothetical protein GLA29479_3797 [Lysobacter antibioticus]
MRLQRACSRVGAARAATAVLGFRDLTAMGLGMADRGVCGARLDPRPRPEWSPN